MNIKLILIVFFVASNIYSQSKKCNGIVNWKYTEIISIYDEPNGSEMYSIKNDKINEDFISLIILDETKEFFCVDISLEMSDKTYNGWIRKIEHIGAIIKNEQEYMNLTLFESQDISNSKKIELKKWKSEFITIESCENKWTLISVNYNGKRIKGWIESNKLCANNYSTCS